jgi:hypothetical protein
VRICAALGAGESFDRLCTRDPMQRSYFLQVRTKRSSTTRGDLQLSPVWNWHRVQPVEIATQNFFQFTVIQLQCVEEQDTALRLRTPAIGFCSNKRSNFRTRS